MTGTYTKPSDDFVLRAESRTETTTVTNQNTSILIFTDGACTGNPGPGGWGSIMALPDGTIRELGGNHPQTTNNRMEMAAAIHALAKVENTDAKSIVLYTDSTYLIRGITQWVWGWRSRGWKTADGKDVANRELWEELSRHVARLKPITIEWKYVRGHAGFPGNERCDEIAVAFANGKREPLYTGSRDGYFVDLTHLPDAEPVPDPKNSKSNSYRSSKNSSSSATKSGAGAVTYLSYFNGVVTRHRTWADCEKLVKGRNAKFKKAKSSQEERSILEGWGLSPDTRIE